MSLLTDAEIAAARADLEAMLPDTATIARNVETSDGAGGFDETPQTVASGVPCRLSATFERDKLRVAGERVVDDTTHSISFPASTDVKVGDQITIGALMFEALALVTAGQWELLRHALVRAART
jgi:hypothetical protein